MTVYTKEKLAKFRTAVFELLIKVGLSAFSLTKAKTPSRPNKKRSAYIFVKTDKNMELFLLNTLHRFSKKLRLPVWLRTFESVKSSTDFTVSSVRKANCQILVSDA